jgi:alpha-ketoglutarate-dependent 2,4-dichlorophenoxyacetate dioxygenase
MDFAAHLKQDYLNRGGGVMNSFRIEPLHEDFGVRITGIDLSCLPDKEIMEDIIEAIDRHAFLLFPDQSFDDERQLEFTAALGEPEVAHVALGEEGKIEHFGTIGNVQPDGTAIGNEHRKTVFSTGNNMWHSDSSFREVPSFVSIMAAYETPDEGGETLFASGRAAYARLDDTTRAELDPLIAIHDYTYSRSKVAPDAVAPSLSASLPPVRQRLVRTNPRTGARNLFIGSHAREIEGWGYDKSRPTLERLVEETTRDEHIYAHKWRPGDFVIWDNRCLIHRGAGYDADKYRRYMRQTRVRGSCSSLEE